MKSIIFKALSWHFEDVDILGEDAPKAYFFVSGVSTETKKEGSHTSIKLRIENFHPFCHVELPKQIEWQKKACDQLVKHITSHAKGNGKWQFTKPICFKFVEKFDLYGKIPKKYLYLEFDTQSSCRNF